MVIALIALFVALGGTGYAATELGHGHAGATAAKKKKKPVVSLRGPRGPKGATGATGALGAPGATGAPGPSDAFSGFNNGPVAINSSTLESIGTLNVPAGSYVIVAKTWATDNSGSATLIKCQLTAGGDTDTTRAQLETGAGSAEVQALAFNVVHTFSAPGSVNLACASFVNKVSFSDIKITAIKVGNLTNGALGA
jgi:hypothetical protein